MKNLYVYISVLFMLIPFVSNAQIGIYTSSPVELLHIHIGNVPTDLSDDIVVTNAGNMGIGTVTPTTKLEIRTKGTSSNVIPGMRLQDGGQAVGKRMVSDATGNAKWDIPIDAFTVFGEIPISSTVTTTASSFNGGYAAYTGMSITLDPGDYQINFSAFIEAVGSVSANISNRTVFSSIFLSQSLSTPITPITTYFSDVRSIIINPNANQSIYKYQFYGSGSMPIRVGAKSTYYIYAFLSANIYSGTDLRMISYYGADSASQIYATPIYIVNE